MARIKVGKRKGTGVGRVDIPLPPDLGIDRGVSGVAQFLPVIGDFFSRQHISSDPSMSAAEKKTAIGKEGSMNLLDFAQPMGMFSGTLRGLGKYGRKIAKKFGITRPPEELAEELGEFWHAKNIFDQSQGRFSAPLRAGDRIKAQTGLEQINKSGTLWIANNRVAANASQLADAVEHIPRGLRRGKPVHHTQDDYWNEIHNWFDNLIQEPSLGPEHVKDVIRKQILPAVHALDRQRIAERVLGSPGDLLRGPHIYDDILSAAFQALERATGRHWPIP